MASHLTLPLDAARSHAMHAVLIEDDERLARLTKRYLEGHEVVIDWFADGRSGLEHVLRARPDIVLLDLQLPQLDGIAVCRELRARSDVPILMITARVEEADRVLGLELGADDYITKPFSIREFRSRVRALLRRAASPHLAGEREEVVERGELRIDVPRRTVEVRGETVQLTFIEFEMLVVLASSPGVVFSRRELLERLRGGADYREPRTIDVHVRHLREKIESDPSDPELILTMRGAGYRFRPE